MTEKASQAEKPLDVIQELLTDSVPGTATQEKKPEEPTTETKNSFEFKLKIDGSEESRSFSEEQVVALIQKGLAADKRFQEASDLKKEYEQKMQAQKTEAPDADKEYLLKKIDKLESTVTSLSGRMSEEQRKRDYDKQYAEYTAQLKSLKDEFGVDDEYVRNKLVPYMKQEGIKRFDHAYKLMNMEDIAAGKVKIRATPSGTVKNSEKKDLLAENLLAAFGKPSLKKV